MDTKLLSAMISRGLPPEHILIVAEIIDAWTREIDEIRRAKDRQRKAAGKPTQRGPSNRTALPDLIPPSAPLPARKKPPRKEHTYLTPDTEPTEAQIAYAVGFGPGMSREAALEEFRRFRDYWVGHGKPMVDWLATWRNWVSKMKPDERRELEQLVRPKTGKPTDHLTGAGRSNGFGGFVAYALAHAEQLSAEDAKKRELETSDLPELDNRTTIHKG